MFVLVAVMLALLPLLAALQYSWLGQVSRGQRESTQATLRTTAAHFSQDFDRELTRAYMIFQVASARINGQNGFAQAYDLWTTTAPHPRLIREIFWTQPEPSGQLRLKRFNTEAKQFESSEWPAVLTGLHQRLRQHQQLMNSDVGLNLQGVLEKLGQTSTSAGKAQVHSGMIFRSTISQVVEDPAALLIPVSLNNHAPSLASQSSGQPGSAQRPSLRLESRQIQIGSVPRSSNSVPGNAPGNALGNESGNEPRSFRRGQMMTEYLSQSYLIVTLDLDYMQREFLPALIKQNFLESDALNYNLAMISRSEPRKIIYQSGTPQPLEAWSAGDATAILGSVRLDDLRNLALDSLVNRGAGQGDNSPHPDHLAISILSNSPLNVKLPKRTGDEGKPWELVIKHRAGSLEVAVESTRRQNLLISFGVLLLLGLSVGLLVVSTRRAQHLAQQQMEFVSAVTHELRTPLSVIRSAGENLADGLIDERGQVRRYGELIAGEGRRLTEMIEQVLEFAGAQSGRKTYELRPTEISAVIETMLADCRPQIIEGGFHIELDLPANLPLIKADVAALRHAMQNLLSNAMKYSGESRWIGLRARAVMSEQRSELQIIIADHGLGIAPDDLPHIFEPFYRGREVVAAQIHGNGLGLSLVKRIIEAHGGSVSVESAPSRGSTFTLHLPATAQANEIANAQTEETLHSC